RVPFACANLHREIAERVNGDREEDEIEKGIETPDHGADAGVHAGVQEPQRVGGFVFEVGIDLAMGCEAARLETDEDHDEGRKRSEEGEYDRMLEAEDAQD